eukprot:6462385-Amphidinium_carterae.1
MKLKLASVLAGRRVVIYIDNEGARLNLIKGSSSNRDCVSLLKEYFKSEVQSPTLTWFARVPSKSNPADAPSRLQLQGLEEMLGAFRLMESDFPRELEALWQ